jgi:hypothetical protein
MDNQSTPSLEPLSTYPARTPKKKNRMAGILAIIVFLIVLIILGKKLFSPSKQISSETLSPTPSPTEFQFPTDTPEASVSPTSGVTPSPTAKAAANPVDSKTGLDRSAVSVEVLNGSGTVGAASKAADILKGLGYNVTSTGNADNFDFAKTEIHTSSAKSNYLSLVQSDLSSSYTIGTADSNLDASSSADIEVIVGAQ